MIGFIASSFPQILQIFQAKGDRAHELDIMKMQIDLARLNIQPKLDEIKYEHDIEQLKEVYSTYNSGATWVQNINALVRPIVTFALLGIYIGIQWFYYEMLLNDENLMQYGIDSIWTQEDQNLLTICFAYYFGSKLQGNR